MNTPSPALLRKALKIVNEIEKLDQQIYRLLTQAQQTTVVKRRSELTQMTEEALSHFPEALQVSKKKEKTKQVAKEKTSMIPPAPHHEQQSLLMDDVDVKLQSSVRDAEPSVDDEQQDEQTCCLF